MRADLRDVGAALALGATIAAVGYTAFALARLRAFTRRPPARSHLRPPLTIIKPVHGLEYGLEANLRTFCTQDYPDYEVVLGVLDPADSALPMLRRIVDQHPDRVKLAVGDGVARHANPKIATLAALLPHARHDLLVVADSDMRVGRGYADAIAAAFDDPAVGAVTCIYRGEPASGLASMLGAMAITEQFAPSALVATALAPLTYCFGGTMAVRRAVLDEIGGLDALGARIADDAALGKLTAAHGHRVALADYVAATFVDEPNVGALLRHELRWARTIRTVRPRGYPGLIVTYPLPLGLLYLALARRRRRALAVLGLAAAARAAMHRGANRMLGTGRPSPLRLVALRDLLGVGVWLLGLRGTGVRWRGRALRITPDGAIVSAEPRTH